MVESAVRRELERGFVIAVIPNGFGHALVVVSVGEGRLAVGGKIGDVVVLVIVKRQRSTWHSDYQRTAV